VFLPASCHPLLHWEVRVPRVSATGSVGVVLVGCVVWAGPHLGCFSLLIPLLGGGHRLGAARKAAVRDSNNALQTATSEPF